MALDNKESGFFSKDNDLRNRILFTIFILSIYRIGTYVPLPSIDPESLKTLMQSNQRGLLGMLNIFSGGAVQRMAIFALGIMPYISSSIIIQLLTGVSETPVSNCIIIDDEIYGIIPNANIAIRFTAPPENTLNIPISPLWLESIKVFKDSGSIPGSGTYVPKR